MNSLFDVQFSHQNWCLNECHLFASAHWWTFCKRKEIYAKMLFIYSFKKQIIYSPNCSSGISGCEYSIILSIKSACVINILLQQNLMIPSFSSASATVYPFLSSSVYGAHLFAIMRPHEKHRTGISMIPIVQTK